MSRIDVYLWGRKVGAMDWHSQQRVASFAYEREFLNSGIEISPIVMPLSDEVYSFPNLSFETFQGLPGAIADSLPDRFGRALIETYFENKGYSFEDLSPTDVLAYMGTRGMGGLEYQPATPIELKTHRINISELKLLAAFGLDRATGLDTHIGANETEGFQDILTVGTSAGGARAKAVIAFNESTGEIRSGQLEHGAPFEQWLIKLDVGANEKALDSPQGYGRIEYTYYQMAKRAGIEMSECRLMEDQSRAHFMTRRFDRVQGEKLHLATLSGIRHIDYNDVASHSYNQLFETARYLQVPYKDQEQLFRQMVFNVVMVNCDDHTKNFSFLLDEHQPQQWRVSPAYDLAYSYDRRNAWVNDHMAIQGKRKEITLKDLEKEGTKHGIKRPVRIAEQVMEAATNWQSLAKENRVSQIHTDKIQQEINRVNRELKE